MIVWIYICKIWAKDSRHLGRRIIPIVFITTLITILFFVAGLLSSKIASMTGQEVLIRGGSCGVNILGHHIAGQDKNPEVETNKGYFTLLLPFLAQRLVSFSNYALNCYTNNPSSKNCNTFVKPHLPYMIKKTAGCPFEKEMCRLADRNLFIDTGYINSHFDFGINTRPEERFLYRRTTHCAPLVTDGYKSSFKLAGSERTFTQYSYSEPHRRIGNVTYTCSVASLAEFRARKGFSAIEDYTLGAAYYNVINGSVPPSETNLRPIRQLSRSDADVTLIFLSSNWVASPVPIDDPWYSAHRTIPGYRLNLSGWGNLTLEGHFADQDGAVLGCAKQYQINPSHCSRFGGKQELDDLLQSLPHDGKRLNLTRWSIMAALTGNEIDAYVQTLGVTSLSARYNLVAGIQGPLPNDQWQSDVINWHSSSLASIQGSAIDSATGPSHETIRQFWPPPANNEEKYICNNQKILSAAHLNFNVLGLSLVFGIGGLIVVTSFALEPLVSFLQKRYSVHQYSRLEWCTNGTLQLQRLAHEEKGFGPWSECTNLAPICDKDAKLACLDISDLEHPILRGFSPVPSERPSSTSNNKSEAEQEDGDGLPETTPEANNYWVPSEPDNNESQLSMENDASQRRVQSLTERLDFQAGSDDEETTLHTIADLNRDNRNTSLGV